MKTLKRLSVLAILFVFLFSGCEKDPLQPDKNALRISKIADNSAMIDPLWEFEYDSDGYLIGISGDENRGTTTITYNSEDLPEMISWVTDDFSSGDESEYYATSHIVWGNNSFVLDGDTYTLDANGNITNISWDDSNSGYECTWQEDRAEIYYYRDGSNEWAQTRVFNQYNSPLSAINLAIINACDISWIYDECDWIFQNKYCLSTNSSADEGSADYDCDYNDDGYPTRIRIIEEGSFVMYLCIEYETD